MPILLTCRHTRPQAWRVFSFAGVQHLQAKFLCCPVRTFSSTGFRPIDPILSHYVSILEQRAENISSSSVETLRKILGFIDKNVMPLLLAAVSSSQSTEAIKGKPLTDLCRVVFGYKLLGQLRLGMYFEAIETLKFLEESLNIPVDERILCILFEQLSKVPASGSFSSDLVRSILDWIGLYNQLLPPSTSKSGLMQPILPTSRLLVAIIGCIKRTCDLSFTGSLYNLLKTMPDFNASHMKSLLYTATRYRHYTMVGLYLRDISEMSSIGGVSIDLEIPSSFYSHLIDQISADGSDNENLAIYAMESFFRNPTSNLEMGMLKACLLIAQKNSSIRILQLLLENASDSLFLKEIYNTCLSVGECDTEKLLDWILTILCCIDSKPIFSHSIDKHLVVFAKNIGTAYRTLHSEAYLVKISDVFWERHSATGKYSNLLFNFIRLVYEEYRLANPAVKDEPLFQAILGDPEDFEERLKVFNLSTLTENLLAFHCTLHSSIIRQDPSLARKAIIDLDSKARSTPNPTISTIPVLMRALFQRPPSMPSDLEESWYLSFNALKIWLLHKSPLSPMMALNLRTELDKLVKENKNVLDLSVSLHEAYVSLLCVSMDPNPTLRTLS